MKVGELIRALQAADPSGELPVCVDNYDIYTVEALPAHYDGPIEQLVHDESRRGKQWSIIGARIISRGEKVRLTTMPIADLLFDKPEMSVDVAPGSRFAADVERWRTKGRE